MKKIHRMRERKPRRKFLNLRHAIIWAITAITHLSQLTIQTNGQPPSLMYFLNFGHNRSTQMWMDSLKTFHLLVQLLLSQPSSRTDLSSDSLARRSRRSIHAPDLSCPVKLRPLKYRAGSVRSFSATAKRAKSCPLRHQRFFSPGFEGTPRGAAATRGSQRRTAVSRPPAIKPHEHPLPSEARGL